MNVSYRYVKDKVVICIDGAYTALTPSQYIELQEVMKDIDTKGGKHYKEDARRK